MKEVIRILVGAACSMVWSSIVWADVLAAWNVDGIELDAGSFVAPYQLSATGAAEYVAAVLTLGSGVSPSTTAGQYGFKISDNAGQTSLVGAIDNDHYIEFALTVSSGYRINLGSLQLNGEASSTGCSNVALMSSVAGFVAGQEIASANAANKTGGFDTDASGFGGTIDITDADYQNLTGTVAFRLYGWNSTSGSGVTYIRNLSGNDLIINGTIEAIPEPVALGFAALGGLGFLVGRRIFGT